MLCSCATTQPCYFYYAQANIIRSRQSDIKSFFFSTTRFVLGVLSAQGVGLMQHFQSWFWCGHRWNGILITYRELSRPHHPLYVQCSPRSFTPGSRECVMLTLNFSSALPGTVLDKDGQGTGFTYVQPNTTGNRMMLPASTLSQRLAPSYLQALPTNTTVNT